MYFVMVIGGGAVADGVISLPPKCESINSILIVPYETPII